MRKLNFSLFILLFSLCETVLGQRQKPVIIPFELTDHNNLSIRAILNGKDTVRLMFHTAASSLMLTEEATNRITSLQFDRTDSVSSWGGGGNTSRFSKSNSLQIGTQTWDSLPVWEDKNSGPGTDGKFGPNLFANTVIEIDFDNKVIVLSEKLPAKAKKYDKLPLVFKNDNMFVQAVCAIGTDTFTNRFLLHSGYAGDVLLDDQFVADHKMSEKLTIVDEKSLKDSFGKVVKTKRAILPSFHVGKQTLTDIPVGFFEGSIGRQKMSIIGADVLKRFNIIIDAQRTFIYLKANRLNKSGYINV
jgi:hypothetical protein